MNQIVAPNYIATLNTRLYYVPVCDHRKTLYIVIIVITLLIFIQLVSRKKFDSINAIHYFW